MKICMVCKWESPDNTNFCGQCGQKFVSPEDSSTGNSVTRGSGLHTLNKEGPLVEGNATIISSSNEDKTVTPPHHRAANVPLAGQDEDQEHEILHPFDDIDEERIVTIPLDTTSDTKKDEDEDGGVFVPFPIIPENAPTPFQGNMLAQAPLPIDHVPYAPAPHFPQPTVPPSPQPAPLFQPSPLQLHATISPSPVHSPMHHHPLKHLHRHHIRPTCLVVVIVAFIALSGLLAIMIFSPKPTPILTPIAKLIGAPIPGQRMILHGGRFVPRETVRVLIDYKPTAFTGSLPSNSLSIGGLSFQHPASPPGIKEIIRADGTFNLTITVDPSWPVGSVHTVYVYRQDGTLIKLPPFVVITPATPTGLIGCLDEAAAIRLGPISENSTQPVSKTITLCTQGSGQVNWAASWDQKVLKLSSSSGQIQAPQEGKLTISASARGLKPGAYTTTILFNSRQSMTRVPLTVVFVIVKASSPGQTVTCISVAPQSVSFTTVANQPALLSKNVTVNNCGDAGKWTASITTSDGKPWLGVGPSQGTIRNGWFQGVFITASSATLAPGLYTGRITFQIGSSSRDVAVTFTVRQQETPITCIDTNTRSLTFVGVAGQSDPPAQSVMLTNCGTAGRWSITLLTYDGINWIHPGLHSHILKKGDRQQINVSVSSAQLTKGTYFGELIVSMGSSSVKVTITFIVQEACLHVDYPSLLFKSTVGDSALQDTITITNCGYAGTWYGSTSTDDEATWLTIDKASGHLQAGASQRIKVNVSSAHMHEGTYTGNILFIMGASKVNVRVKFILVKPDIICLSPNKESLAFSTYVGENPDSQEVTIGNCGNTTEAWTASLNGTAWLGIDVANGTLKSGDSRDVLVSLSSSHLAVGTYTGHITFSAGSSSRDLEITLRVHERIIACITSDLLSLTFNSTIIDGRASTPDARTVKLTNCGSEGSLSATPITDDGAPWLGTTLANDHPSAGATSNGAVAVDTSGLHVGSYTALIPFIITVSTGAQDVVNVKVQLTVEQQTPPSPCTANPSTLTFTSIWGQPVPPAQNVTLTNCGADDTWTASFESGGLFNLDTYGGTLDKNGSQVINIEPDGHGYEPGHYANTFTFTTGAGKTTSVNAVWDILQPPNPTCIQVDSTSLSFPDQSGNTGGGISFSNCGAYPGYITVTGSTLTNWLTISSYGNTPIDGSGLFPIGYGPSVFANADSTNLSPGPHTGTITGTITTAQGSKSVSLNVAFTVATPPTPPTPIIVPVVMVTPTDTPTDTPIAATDTPTDTPIVTVTDTPTDTPVVTVTDTPTDTPIVTVTDTPVVTVTDTPTDTPIPPTDTPVPPTDTPIPPTDTPTPTP